MKKWLIFAIIGFIVLGAAIFIFTNFISSEEVEDIPKPELNYDENGFPIITEEHIAYVIHQLGGNSLRNIPFTKNYPQIEVLLQTKEQFFTADIIDKEITVKRSKSSDPDIQIRLTEENLVKLVEAENTKEKTKELRKAGFIGVTTLANSRELFFKGYFKIYDTLK